MVGCQSASSVQIHAKARELEYDYTIIEDNLITIPSLDVRAELLVLLVHSLKLFI